MVQPIVRDAMFLAQPSAPATAADRPVVIDLMDTLRANAERCVGMAANMIGVRKRIIVVAMGALIVPMINPKIVSKRGAYPAQEGCLSLPGVRPTVRYETIAVEFLDAAFKKCRRTYSGSTAQIIQHEIDHCDGVLI